MATKTTTIRTATISRPEPTAPAGDVRPAGTPTAERAQTAPAPANVVPPSGGVKAVGEQLPARPESLAERLTRPRGRFSWERAEDSAKEGAVK